MIPLSWYLYFAAALFSIGLFGVLSRKNAIAILMGIELMLNAVNINFIQGTQNLYFFYNSSMSTIFSPFFRGQKRLFFCSFFVPFLLQNHYMLWSNPICVTGK
jgi:hypothetical protein